jgi:prepilin-type N-terminal cleavage/methylation domain-containing protein
VHLRARRTPTRAISLQGHIDVRGFSLLEVLIVVAVISVVGAMSAPAITNMLPNIRVSNSARAVERQLQMARLKAVATNRPMRVRFNCPGTGEFRMVELIGTPGVPTAADANDYAATRCGLTAYPHPDTARGIFDVPNHDGPVQTLEAAVAFVSVSPIEFWPDGTAHADAGSGNPWPRIPTNAPVQVTLRRSDGTTTQQLASLKTIEVNGLGRIRLF